MEKRTPYLKFKGFLVENQIKYGEVADLLDITIYTFNNKINRNHQDFNAEEIRRMCKKYSLDANKFFLI